MIKFQIGDQVRIVGLPNSEWYGSSGIIVNTMERLHDDQKADQECAVQFSSGRRWFLSADLVRTIPDRTLRFFRSEVLYRWADLSPEDVLVLNGDPAELIALLQERYGFGLKRATIETDDVVADVQNRLRLATDRSLSPRPNNEGPIALKISA